MRAGLGEVQPEYRGLLETYLGLLLEELGGRLRSVAVFGSVARWKAGPGSDVDLLLVVDDLPLYVDERIALIRNAYSRLRESSCYRELRKKGLGCTVSEVILTPEELAKHPPILLEVLKDGVILYDKDGVVERELKALARRLEELGAKVVETERGHYWILKPDLKPGEEVVV